MKRHGDSLGEQERGSTSMAQWPEWKKREARLLIALIDRDNRIRREVLRSRRTRNGQA